MRSDVFAAYYNALHMSLGREGRSAANLADRCGLDTASAEQILYALEKNGLAARLASSQGITWTSVTPSWLGKLPHPGHQVQPADKPANLLTDVFEFRSDRTDGDQPKHTAHALSLLAKHVQPLLYPTSQREDAPPSSKEFVRLNTDSFKNMVAYIAALRNEGAIKDEQFTNLLMHACSIYVENMVEEQVQRALNHSVAAFLETFIDAERIPGLGDRLRTPIDLTRFHPPPYVE